MGMKITKDSHVDHGLTVGQLDFLKKTFADRSAFLIETVELPEELGTVECALVGPAVGMPPIHEDDVTYAIRGNRKVASRVWRGVPDFNTDYLELNIRKPIVKPKVRQVTVIAGPHDGDPCVLYTAYGGPQAPREPGDPGLKTMLEIEISRAFWREHALIVD